MRGTLSCDDLPPLPQCATLTRLAARLWEDEDVVALWVGGSLASGTADEYSDVDLRVAVKPNTLKDWKTPDFERLFEGEYLGGNRFPFGEDAFLHHLLLTNGDIFDFWVQSAERDPAAEKRLVLGCRDAEYRRRLASIIPQAAVTTEAADPAILHQVLVDFWINTHKHRKVLYRDLDLIAITGINMERALLVRFWHILATGRDSGTAQVTIHSLTQTAHALRDTMETHRWRLLGAPLTTRQARCKAIEDIRDEVAVVGRTLADTLGFDYPDRLERTVRGAWQKYRDAHNQT